MKKMIHYLALISFLLIISRNGNSQSVSLPKTTYAPGEKIVVTFSGFAGLSRDWISIAAPGSADDKYLIWTYTPGTTSGTVSFDGQAYGNYEIRGYFNNESIIRARISFTVGNTAGDGKAAVPVAKTVLPNYKPYEKITVEYSGLPGNRTDWISLSIAGSADDKYVLWLYTDGKQIGTMEFSGLAEGSYEVRSYFNGEFTVRSRSSFTVSKTSSAKMCRTELSTFYAGMNALGLAWGNLGADVNSTIPAVQATIGNAIAGLKSVPCIDFGAKLSDFSARLPGISRIQATTEIDLLIKELQGVILKTSITCDKGASLVALFTAGIHLGASQAIANSFMCGTITPAWRTNLSNHLVTAKTGLGYFSTCIPGVSLSVFDSVPVGGGNAYVTMSYIIGIHIQLMWAISLSDCCCYCN